MKQFNTKAIVLRRTNYGEADRILTLITPNHGKLHLMAKGVRREKSKLAGGIELLSESLITVMEGRGELDILMSSRLEQHYPLIIKDLIRTSTAFRILFKVQQTTEDNCDGDYYALLHSSLIALNDLNIPSELVDSWSSMRLLTLQGIAINLRQDTEGQPLVVEARYRFDIAHGHFIIDPDGRFGALHIKLLRLMQTRSLQAIMLVGGIKALLTDTKLLLDQLLEYYLQIKVA